MKYKVLAKTWEERGYTVEASDEFEAEGRVKEIITQGGWLEGELINVDIDYIVKEVRDEA